MTDDILPPSAQPDRLSALLERYPVHARLSFSGTLCGIESFPARPGIGHLHVLRHGALDVRHDAGSGLPERLHLDQPSLLFYPRPASHHFHHPPQQGADFTCAELQFDGGGLHPLAAALPALVTVPLAEVPGLAPVLDLLFAEADRVRCGQRLLVDRLFEVLLIQLMRWLLDHPRTAGVQSGLLAGLAHPQLARALVAMHETPGAAWTVALLAHEAGMSRTRFATLFREMTGYTPADYLTGWRLALVRSGLRRGRPLELLAHELGYSGAAALSRVFRAHCGQAPRAWLRQQHASEPASA